MTTTARAAQATVTPTVDRKARPPRASTAPHRPLQQRHRLSRPGANILEKAESALTAKAIEMAMRGDRAMLRFCLDQLDRRRDGERKHVGVDLPEIKSVGDIQGAIRTILKETAKGSIEPEKALKIVDIIGNLMNSMNNSDLLDRLEKLDASTKD